MRVRLPARGQKLPDNWPEKAPSVSFSGSRAVLNSPAFLTPIRQFGCFACPAWPGQYQVLSSALSHPFLGEGSSTKIDRNKLVACSNLSTRTSEQLLRRICIVFQPRISRHLPYLRREPGHSRYGDGAQTLLFEGCVFVVLSVCNSMYGQFGWLPAL